MSAIEPALISGTPLFCFFDIVNYFINILRTSE